MKKNKSQIILLIIFAIVSIAILVFGITKAIRNKKIEEPTKGKITVNFSANGQVDVVTQPNPNENITLKTLPDTDGRVTELNFNDFKKLFMTTKKSILAIVSDDCTSCSNYKSILNEGLEEMDANAYIINVTKLSKNGNVKKYIEYTNVPTIYVIESGKVSHSLTGMTDKETIGAFVDYFYIRES